MKNSTSVFDVLSAFQFSTIMVDTSHVVTPPILLWHENLYHNGKDLVYYNTQNFPKFSIFTGLVSLGHIGILSRVQSHIIHHVTTVQKRKHYFISTPSFEQNQYLLILS